MSLIRLTLIFNETKRENLNKFNFKWYFFLLFLSQTRMRHVCDMFEGYTLLPILSPQKPHERNNVISFYLWFNERAVNKAGTKLWVVFKKKCITGKQISSTMLNFLASSVRLKLFASSTLSTYFLCMKKKKLHETDITKTSSRILEQHIYGFSKQVHGPLRHSCQAHDGEHHIPFLFGFFFISFRKLLPTPINPPLIYSRFNPPLRHFEVRRGGK